MIWATLIIELIPVIMKLLGMAEKLWIDKGSGSQKKKMVMTTSKEIVKSKSNVDDWNKIEGTVSKIVDASCAVIYPNKDDSHKSGGGELLNED